MNKHMKYKLFHNEQLPPLGMGCLRLPMEPDQRRIDRTAAQKVIDLAYQKGICYFDTAYTYQQGDSERFLGEALSKYPRNSYYLATKFYVSANPDIRQVFEEQQERLKTSYFDFYLLHSLDENSISAYTDKDRDYIGYLLEQKKRGNIRYIGFSSHAAPETLSRFLEYYSGFDMALIQMNYLDWTMLEAKKQYEILTGYGIPVWVMEPLKGGRLSTLNQEAADILKAAAPDRSLSSWAFRFLAGLDNVQMVLSGMSTEEQLLDNVRTFEYIKPLNNREQQVLKQAVSAFIKDLGVPCSGCRYCCPYCPADLDIPMLIKGYNEQNIIGETWRVAELVNRRHGPKDCLQCGSCLSHCPQKIDIPGTIKKFAAMLK